MQHLSRVCHCACPVMMVPPKVDLTCLQKSSRILSAPEEEQHFLEDLLLEHHVLGVRK